MKKSQIKIILYFFLVLSGFSCKVQKDFKTVVIPKGQRFYAYSSDVGVKLTHFESLTKVSASIREDPDAVFISISKDDTTAKVGKPFSVTLPASVVSSVLSETRAFTSPPKYLFGTREAGFDNNFEGGFTYRQLRPYVQAVAIAVKFRGPVGNALQQVETGSTFALAGGFKNSWSKYKGAKNSLGFTTRTWSIASGLLLGGGVVDIGTKTTQGQVLDTQASKNFIIPVGLHLVVGFNNINLGVAVGQDIITGPNKTLWNYYKKPWVGILVGLDIIK